MIRREPPPGGSKGSQIQVDGSTTEKAIEGHVKGKAASSPQTVKTILQLVKSEENEFKQALLG